MPKSVHEKGFWVNQTSINTCNLIADQKHIDFFMMLSKPQKLCILCQNFKETYVENHFVIAYIPRFYAHISTIQ